MAGPDVDGKRFLEDDLLVSPEGLLGPTAVGFYRDKWNDPLRQGAVFMVLLPSTILLLIVAWGAILLVRCRSTPAVRSSVDMQRFEKTLARLSRLRRWFKVLFMLTLLLPVLTVGIVMDGSYVGVQYLTILLVVVVPLLVAWISASRSLAGIAGSEPYLRRRLEQAVWSSARRGLIWITCALGLAG